MHAAAVLWTLANALAASPAGVPAWHEEVAQPLVLPGGVADSAGRYGYFANPAGGVSAVDLRNGKVLWESPAAHRPILVTSERLYASTSAGDGRLRVVGLDTTGKGATVFESDPITVPPAVEGRPQTLVWTTAKDHLRLTWEERGDAAPRGGAAIDLRSGHVEPLLEGLFTTPPKPPADLAKRVVRWQGVVGGVYKALVLEETAEGQRLVLCGWDIKNGQPLAPRELLQGKRLLVRATLNEQYLCLRDAIPSPDQKTDERGRHAWSIFDARTGELVTRLPYEPGTQAVAVLGLRAYCLVAGPVRGSVSQPFMNARVLKAVELKTGKTVWERPAEGKLVNPAGT
jgi:hypothetical protein